MNLPFDSLPEPGNRFTLGEEIGRGAWARVSPPNITQMDSRQIFPPFCRW